MESSEYSTTATCPTCATLIDVSAEEPFAKVHCAACGTWMRVRQLFANFEINGVLGEGGQGMVYRGEDKTLGRQVAIKLMKREYSEDPIFVQRFKSEAETTAGLNHPNVVKVFSFGESQGLLYLAMEMVDQGSLDSLIARDGKVPELRVLEVGIQIAKGLQAGLAKGLIHRDIKPGNILFADEHTAKLVDFGLAILVEKQHEEVGEMWATPFYVAPEKLDGSPEDFRCDMYSLAASLFHAIAGRPPFIAETSSMSELMAIKSEPVHLQTYAPQTSAATAYVLDKALNVKPEDRFASYEEFIQNLEYARNELRKRPAYMPRPKAVVPANPGGAWVTFLIIAMIVAGGLYFYTHREQFLGAPAAQITTTKPTKGTKDDAPFRYEQATKKLLNGKYAAAAAAFHEIYAEGSLQEPQNSWSAVHESLAELLLGRLDPARAALDGLGKHITPTAIGLDPKLVSFFTRLAALGSSKEPVSPDAGKEFDRRSYETLGLLVLGLKNWEAGAHEDGVALLRQYQMSYPAGDSEWVREYRTVLAPYFDEYMTFKNVADDLKKYETDPERAGSVLKNIGKTKEKIKSSSLLAKLNEIERDLSPKIAEGANAVQAAMDKKKADEEGAEGQTLTEAKMKLKSLCDTYRFQEAQVTLRLLDLKLEKNTTDRDTLLQRMTWLAQFKEQLVKDLTTSGYTGALLRKNGQSTTGTIIRASDIQIETKLPFGTVAIPWAELAPQSLLAIARGFMKPNITPAELADREWQAGVFCIFEQLVPESQAYMDAAAAIKDDYKIQKALFFGEAPAEPAPTPADAAPATVPGTGTEMSDKNLNPTKPDISEIGIKSVRKPQ